VKFVEVIFATADVGGEGEGSKVAYGCFVRGRILDYLSAQIRRLDSAEVLMVGFGCDGRIIRT
jgi:hypothetical protein